MKQGTLSLAVKSEEWSALLAVKRNPSKLACYQEKLFQVNPHCTVVVSGITADARVLVKYMRVKNAKHKLKYGTEMTVNQIAGKVAKIFRSKTNVSGKRPFGCGILLTGKDHKEKFRIYEISPDGNCVEYEAQAMGLKSQTCKTYLEKNFDKFKGLNSA